jgi:NhaP-type Na+/H+ or K+/H+ antiporter
VRSSIDFVAAIARHDNGRAGRRAYASGVGDGPFLAIVLGLALGLVLGFLVGAVLRVVQRRRSR